MNDLLTDSPATLEVLKTKHTITSGGLDVVIRRAAFGRNETTGKPAR